LSFHTYAVPFPIPPAPRDPTLFPYTTLFRSWDGQGLIKPRPGLDIGPHAAKRAMSVKRSRTGRGTSTRSAARAASRCGGRTVRRSEEHTSELQSRENLVCRLLLEKKNKKTRT